MHGGLPTPDPGAVPRLPRTSAGSPGGCSAPAPPAA
jgi:hypothetical protein